MARVHRLLLLSLMTVLGTGCTTLHTANLSEGLALSGIKPGDTVEVTTQDGRMREFKVTDVTVNELRGRNIRIAPQDIRLVKIKRLDMRKTLLLGAGIIAVGVGASNSGGGGSGGGY